MGIQEVPEFFQFLGLFCFSQSATGEAEEMVKGLDLNLALGMQGAEKV